MIAKLRLVIEDLGLQRDVRVVKTPQVCFACLCVYVHVSNSHSVDISG